MLLNNKKVSIINSLFELSFISHNLHFIERNTLLFIINFIIIIIINVSNTTRKKHRNVSMLEIKIIFLKLLIE